MKTDLEKIANDGQESLLYYKLRSRIIPILLIILKKTFPKPCKILRNAISLP